MADVLGSIHEIDSVITDFQRVYAISPRSDPLRHYCALCLAVKRLYRHELLNQREDLDKAILHLTESVLLPPHLWLDHGPLIHQALFGLSKALITRLHLSKLPEDAIYAAKYLHYLRDQPHVAFAFPSHAITKSLVYVLAFQITLETGDVAQRIEETAVLCHEIFTSDASEDDITDLVALISTLVLKYHDLWPVDRPIDQVVKCMRAAMAHKPGLRDARFALAICLGTHYCMTYVNDDYEEAVSIMDEIITSTPPGDSQDGFAALAQELVVALAMIRSTAHKTPECLEEAIYRARAFISSFPEHPFSPFVNYSLEVTANQRFGYFGSIEGLEGSSSDSPLSLPVPVVSIRGTT
ncbi:hypothetical protein BJY52DRAFT_873987 [Lactarius psammicola]|nr:hypothetical protein BJY52DRAFT_873987 [Lactarius psammicola]